ncbi:hypothetical protein ACFRKE_22160, partial [Kitasatospora indigofera]
RSSLAHWRGAAGDPAGAAAAFQGVFADRLRVLGPEHRKTRSTRQARDHWREVAARGRPRP